MNSEEVVMQDRIKRLTNKELWEEVLGKVHISRDHVEVHMLVSEFEWRLRKIAFLPALPLQAEEGGSDG